jgi:hypothetical protein
MHTRNAIASIVVLLAAFGAVIAADGNRLAYLDEPLDPYYVHRNFPKLITPQWVGEEGVEAVVVLAIDDMRDPAKYEAYLRPILERLKKIDGRAPVSIMTCNVNPQDPQLQSWLKEGLSIECHTVDHPCPLLSGGDLAKAKSTYDRCVELMNQIPGNRPVAFRMPCCDSKNTPSPRFWTEIFNKATEQENFLSIDSSVFCILTPKDKELPRELVLDADGGERFRKYLPFPSFVNTIEDYPYPYVIGRQCWEFPCIVPSDWEAQYLHKPNNPKTVEDLKAALDAVVIKQGVFNLVFHPHGWIRSEQIVELIDHAVEKHGDKVKFLTFREAHERLNKNLLNDKPLRILNNERNPATLLTPLHEVPGTLNNVALIDLNEDGYLDVDFWGVLSDDKIERRVWLPDQRRWDSQVVPKGQVKITHRLHALTRDVNGDGKWEAISQRADNDGGSPRLFVRGLYHEQNVFRGPPGIVYHDVRGRDTGMRLVDVNGDGKLDLLFSDAERYSLHLFKNMEEGWSIKVIDGKRGEPGGLGPVIPMIVRPDGTNNGAWFHSGHLWVQNEDTDRLPDGVDRLSFEEMLKKHRQK